MCVIQHILVRYNRLYFLFICLLKVAGMYHRSYKACWFTSFCLYYRRSFNVMKLIAIVIFYTALMFRTHHHTNSYGHIFYGIDSWFWKLMILKTLYTDRVLGPYIIMIGKMVKEIFKLFCS